MRPGVIRVVVLALCALLARDATALVLCSTRTRAVTARDACRRGETAIPFASIGTRGAAGMPGATGPDGPPPARVLDAASVEVGPVVFQQAGRLFSQLDTLLTYVLVRRAPFEDGIVLGFGFTGHPTGLVYYTSGDCSGPPLIEVDGLMPVAQAVGSTVFHSAGAPSTTVVHSRESTDQSQGCESITARSGCCRTVSGSVPLQPAATITLDALGFTPPFHAVSQP